MKKIPLLIACCLSAAILFSQPIPVKSIEDSVLGWMKIYNFKGIKEPQKVDAKIYSPNQLSICDSFANWIQKSYTPKGGLGDVKRALSTKLGLYNQNDAALPQSYGAYSKTYIELKYNSSHKMEPVSNSHILWSIMANAPVGYPADIFCTPTEYYFTLPSFSEQGYDENFSRPYALTTHPNTKKYFSYFRRNSAIGNEKTILLYKEGKFPFTKITKGEYLQLVEKMMEREYEKEKKSIHEKEKENAKNIAYFMKYLDDKNAKRLVCLQNNKEKYKNRLQEIAEIFTFQPDILLENYPDVFEGNGSTKKLPVYKIDPAIAELCKKDSPQWIRVTWHGDISDVPGKYQHESIINNFNFDYVYNFFFAPERVKGQPYKPLRSP